MHIDWLKHLKSEDDRKKFVNSLMGSRDILDRLTDLVEEREATIHRSSIDRTTFDNPNWAYTEAYRLGQLAAYSNIKNLTNLKKP